MVLSIADHLLVVHNTKVIMQHTLSMRASNISRSIALATTVFALFFGVQVFSARTASAALTSAQVQQVKPTLTAKCALVAANISQGRANTQVSSQAKALCSKQSADTRTQAGALIKLCANQYLPLLMVYKDNSNQVTVNGWATSGSLYGGHCRKITTSGDLKAFASSSAAPAPSTKPPATTTPTKPNGGATKDPQAGGNAKDTSTAKSAGADSKKNSSATAGEGFSGIERIDVNCPGGGNLIASDTGECIDPAMVECAPQNGDVTVSSKCNLFTKYINPIIKFLSALVSLAVVIGIIMGAIQHATSAGDSQKSANGKRKIQQALIALLVFIFLNAALQWLIPGGVW